MSPRFPLLLATVFLLSCGKNDDTGAPDDTQVGTGAIAATHTVSDVVPTVVFVAWTTAEPGAGSYVEYGLDGALDQVTPVDTSGGTDHEITLLGLKSGKSYSYRAVTELADGTRLEGAIGTVDLAPIPQDLSKFAITVPASADAEVTGGLVMVSQIQGSGESWVVVLDSDADVVWYYKADPNTMIVTSRPSLDGRSVLFAQYDLGQKDDVGKLIRVSLDGREITETRTLLAHHDFVEHTDGTVAWLGYYYEPNDIKVVADAIYEAPEGITDAEQASEVFNWFDATSYDIWEVCSHMQGWASDPVYAEWTHSNSLMYDAATDHYYLMSKFHDTLVKIDRSTGAIVWQMNGLYGDFEMADGSEPWTDVGESALWSHAHMSHLWDGGMAIFDNGYHYLDGEVSRVAEYQWNEQQMTVEKVWEYVEPDGKFTALMGDVRKLEGGNYLVGWSSLGRIDEITPDKQVAWQVSLGLGTISGRTTFLPGDLYPD